jgi:hypothetical protein
VGYGIKEGVSKVPVRWQCSHPRGKSLAKLWDSRCSSPLLSDILSLMIGCLLILDSDLSEVYGCLYKIRLI